MFLKYKYALLNLETKIECDFLGSRCVGERTEGRIQGRGKGV